MAITLVNLHHSSLLDTGTLAGNLLRMGLEMIPERIAATSGWPHRIDGAFLHCPLEKNTFQALLSDPFFTGEPVPHTLEVFFQKINEVYLQEHTDPADLLLINPDITRFSAATVARTDLTGAGIKDKIKTISLDKIHIFPTFVEFTSQAPAYSA